MSDLLTSTSIALGEAYMDGKLEIEGDLFHALNNFLGQMGKFSTDQTALKKLIFSSRSKSNQKKELQSHYDIGNDFYKLWLDETMSYSCGYFKKEGLENLLTVKLMDYRDLPKSDMRFDRVISVGMIEHVGRGNYEEFFDCVKSVLNKGGIFVLHYISALQEHPGDAWVKKYIFPGGVVPSLREITNIAGDKRFYTIGVESLRRHYSKTLLCWNKNFQEHRPTDGSYFHIATIYCFLSI